MISVNLSQCYQRTTLAVYMEQGSIWGGIIALGPLPFPATAVQLDAMLELDYGNRFMFSKLVTKTIAEVSANIVALYSAQWAKLVEVTGGDFNVLSGATKKTTETITRKEDRVNNRDDVNKVSAFNTDDLITDTGSTSNTTDGLTGDTDRVLTEENINLQNAFANLSLLEQSNILKVVNKDVANYLTLSVY